MSGRVELVLAPRDCRHFDTCGAAVCPLDPVWRSAVHLPGERVCHYLLARDKAGAADYYAADPVFAAVQAEAPAVLARHNDIRRAVARAARRGIHGRHLAPGPAPGHAR
jgi:hypothetical protein